ncbi:M20/M25/M40 family metallo-hydrolase [Lactiplantibacillus pentosus]|uniref:M20/M25/M40 family metallo-hydrolase n=1 Tax=Lactiplantibacillus pentosus TaxID=1589 RepID=UPI0021A88F31|nr:M20/M25/M40 family metallo-hydrolase [Lactiplantibacillus pentosus]MCT3308887.1 M20/M25/M40 family metallo-hydrolase [Lactiplantibacillus pentosus]
MITRDQFIDAHQSEFVQELATLVSFKSTSATGDDIEATVTYLNHWLHNNLKAKVEIISTAGNPIILATIAGRSSSTTLFYGHYDVMTPGDLDAWQQDPFVLTARHQRYYGRGAGDNKGQLMAQLLGIYTYLQLHQQLPFTVKLLIEGEEEQGSRNLASTVTHLAENQLQDVKTAIVVDGSMNPDGTHVLRLGNRGLLAFELDVTTGEHDNHSGNLGNVMPNAAMKLWQALEQLYDFQTQQVRIPGFYDGVDSPTTTEQQWLAQLPYDAKQVAQQSGLANLSLDKMAYYQALMFQPTFNINQMLAGDTGAGVKTIIPHRADAKIDCRLVGKQSAKRIYTAIQQLFADDDQIQVQPLGMIPPAQTDAHAPQISWLTQAIQRATGQVSIEPVMPGTVPNYVWTDILKVPTFTIPYANYDQHNHDCNENIEQSAFLAGIRISYEILNQK